jgi:hypothetical protein
VSPRRRLKRIPGGAFIGGRWVWLRADLPRDDFERSGTLAASTRIRGVRIPAGSEIWVDIDWDDISVRLAAPTDLRGLRLPAGSTLKFPSRLFLFPIPDIKPRVLLWLALLLLPFALAWTWWRVRRNPEFAKVVLGGPLALDGRALAAGTKLVVAHNGRVQLDGGG